MGRPTNAATTRIGRRRSAAFSQLTRLPAPASLLLAGVFAFSPSASAAPPPDSAIPSSPTPSDTAASPDPQAEISSFLAAGDTLDALDLLYDHAGQEWADSLLDLVVLPSDAQDTIPSAPPRKAHHRILTRFSFRRIPSAVNDKFWSSSATAAWLLPLSPRAGIEHTLVPSVRIHDIESEQESFRALEPHLSWSGKRGIHRASVDLWGLVGTSNDIGLDARWESRPLAWGWIEAEASASLDAEQQAGLGIGADGERGAWTWDASVGAGWLRPIEPAAYSARMLDVDSLAIGKDRNGLPTLLNTSMDGRDMSADQVRTALANDGDEIESIDPDRLYVRAHLLALHGLAFRYGPGFDLEGRASTGSERWMPHLRDTWTSGTPFLRERWNGRVVSIGNGATHPSANPSRSLIEATYVCIRMTPSLNGTWTSRDGAWEIDALAAWNHVVASDPGHPLEDDRQGFEARLAFQKRW